MEMKIFKRLQKLNQLALTDAEEAAVLAFFDKKDAELAILDAIDTASVERMVHVMPMETIVRDDVAKKLFTRDELQAGAPEAYEGYWQVPRTVE